MKIFVFCSIRVSFGVVVATYQGHPVDFLLFVPCITKMDGLNCLYLSEELKSSFLFKNVN